MLIKHALKLVYLTGVSFALTACYHPPFNDFHKDPPSIKNLYQKNKHYLVGQLQKQDMQFIEYGDTMTLIVPTDHYFFFNTAQLNDICYEGLNNIVRLLKLYPKSRIYVAGFTDNVGSDTRKWMLSQAQAETMLTFLWAHDIPAQLLRAKGYGEHYPIGDNKLIHGSAYNRRIEIQWFNLPEEESETRISMMYRGMKIK